MGAAHSSQRSRAKPGQPAKPAKKKANKAKFYEHLHGCVGGRQLLSCSFGTWCREQRHVAGFSDMADYTSSRAHLTHFSGHHCRPDTTDGRFFRCGFKGRSEVTLAEKASGMVLCVRVPRVTSREMSAYLANHTPGRKRRTPKCAQVVACGGGVAVVQASRERMVPFTKFYVIHLESRTCCGHFVVANSLRRWYEVHVSPSGTHLIIRPEVRYHFQAAIHYDVQNVQSLPPLKCLEIHKVPSYLPSLSLCYNKHLGDHRVLGASQGLLQVFTTNNWFVESSQPLMDPYAKVHQIRSSASGDYVAVRVTFPSFRLHLHNILIYQCPSLHRVLWLDTSAPPQWPLSQLINQQVFPRFSQAESCVAVLTQRRCARRVSVFKLPPRLHPLTHLCRRAVLHLVAARDISALPVPLSVQDFLCEG